MGQRVGIVRESRDAIGNDIVSGGNLVSVDPHWIVNHECSLEEAEGFPGG